MLAKEKSKVIKLRMIDCQKPLPIRINTKETLKQAITDFIIHDRSGAINNYTRKAKNRKYEPINVKLEVNGNVWTFAFELPSILAKYTSLSKSEIQNVVGIEEFSSDILDFIENLEDQAILLSIQVPGEPTSDKVLGILAEKHFREKRRELLQDQYNEVKKTLFTKYKKVLFNDKADKQKHEQEPGLRNSQQNSQRVSRSTVTALMQKEQYGKKHLQVPTKSKLKTLVDSCNVFDFADKVESLRKQRLISQFCGGKQADYIAVRQQVKKHYPCSSSSNLTIETMQQLEDWINDISVSEALFKKKYEPNTQKKQNKRHSEVSSSSDDEST